MPQQDFSFGLIPLFWTGTAWECLLIHHQKGHWAFPKGHADPGETEQETALRELKEETGLSPVQVWWVHPLKEHYTFTDPKGNEVQKEVVFWPAEVSARTVVLQEAEVQSSGWFSVADATERMTFPAGKQVLQELSVVLPDLHSVR